MRRAASLRPLPLILRTDLTPQTQSLLLKGQLGDPASESGGPRFKSLTGTDT